jgi:hypothetical protein
MVMSNPILGGTPQVQNVAVFSADGTCLLVIPPTDVGPDGVVLQSPSAGIWEAYDERRGHFVATQILSDLEGMALGSLTVDGFPLVNEDGASFEDDNEMVRVTIRDASGAVVDSFPGAGARPVRGNRLTFDTAIFPESESGAATPTS